MGAGSQSVDSSGTKAEFCFEATPAVFEAMSCFMGKSCLARARPSGEFSKTSERVSLSAILQTDYGGKKDNGQMSQKDYEHLQCAWGALSEMAHGLRKDYGPRQVTRAHFQAQQIERLIQKLKASYFAEPAKKPDLPNPLNQTSPHKACDQTGESAPPNDCPASKHPWALGPERAWLKK